MINDSNFIHLLCQLSYLFHFSENCYRLNVSEQRHMNSNNKIHTYVPEETHKTLEGDKGKDSCRRANVFAHDYECNAIF